MSPRLAPLFITLDISYLIPSADFIYRLNVNVPSCTAFILDGYHQAVHLARIF